MRKKAIRAQTNQTQGLVINISEESENSSFSKLLWDSPQLDVAIFTIEPQNNTGIQVEPNINRIFFIEDGRANVLLGRSSTDFYYQRLVDSDFMIIIPPGVWWSIENIGTSPLKLVSISTPSII